MNRQQRRAALKQRPPAAGSAAPAGDPLGRLFAEAVRSQQQNQLADAARFYKRVLALKPDHAEACNNLGCVLHAQGKLDEASACFAQSLTLMPQLFKQFRGVLATLAGVLPPIGEAMRRASAAWPKRLTVEQLLGPGGLAAIATNPLLLCMLQSTPVCEVGIERVLTSLRLSLLEAALGGSEAIAGAGLAFCCALAKQCFINEYVFATTPNEDAQADELKAALVDAIKSGAAISPASLAAVAMYRPLHSLPEPAPLLDRGGPPEVDNVLTQQLREPLKELALRTSISSLTPIEDEVSLRVRQQYEESPYPRWVKIASGVQPSPIDGYLGGMFPAADYAPLGKTEDLDILVAGCGTGRHTIWVAQRFQGARVLAVDLSLSSLCYAKRQTPAALAGRIDYLQGDILKLGGIGRSFDLVDASGVLHHMADPLEGWRILLALVRPGGIMHLGFYSETGRRDVVAARAFIAERGYAATPADIRRCRQDLLGTPLDIVTRFDDFFTTSECRDLLFHVQESRTTIPAIKAFIDSHGLRFIGFDFDEAALQKFRALFAQAGWSMTDLDRWRAIEVQYPDTFSGMYQLWVQKADKPA
jgi:SAM-dependent methyltransferase